MVFLGQTKPINLEVNIPVQGFVPGQSIPVKISLKNESNIELRKLRVLFKKVCVCTRITYIFEERNNGNVQRFQAYIDLIFELLMSNQQISPCQNSSSLRAKKIDTAIDTQWKLF